MDRKKKTIILTIVLAIILFTLLFGQNYILEKFKIYSFNKYNPQEVTFLDIRTQEEFKAGHIEGSINIPITVLEETIKKSNIDKGKTIVIYGSNGERSSVGKQILEFYDFESVIDVESMEYWKNGLVN